MEPEQVDERRARSEERFGDLGRLPRTRVSDVKKLGWRQVMKAVRAEGMLVVTNHDEPEAIILSTEEYAVIAKLVQRVERRDEEALETLRQRFDDRLAALRSKEAGDRLRAVMRGGAKLRGKVKVEG
jgi:PHD/YefM family antitoxin component YafN of YafNO toxin-antitoxin module